MNKFYLTFLLFFLFCSHLVLAQDRYAVFYKNKAGTEFSLDKPEDFLTQKALQRRIREGISIDSTDLPVSPKYIQEVEKHTDYLLYHSKWMNASLIVADLETISILEQLPFVDHIEKVAKGFIPRPNDRMQSQGYETKIRKFLPLDNAPARTLANEELPTDFQNSLLGIDKMHEEGFKGEGIIIAVFDVGFPGVNTINAFSHLIRNGQIIDQKDFVRPWSSNVFTDHPHGTNVLSLIGAYEEGTFVSGAPNAEYFLAITEELATEYQIEEYNWLRAAEYADSIGVDIINSSVGYFDFDDPSMNYSFGELDGQTTIITQAANLASAKGILVISSVGNYGPNEPSLTAPSDSPDVLAIGSVNQDLTVVNSSSRGPTGDGRLKPDLVAFGNGLPIIRINGNVGLGYGTSFTAPQVAALAAGLWQAKPEWTREELIDELLRSATQFDNPDNTFGYGIPDFYKAYFGEILSVEEKTEEQPWNVYPNPLIGNELKINFGSGLKSNFTLIDLSGRVIRTKELERFNNKNPFEISLEGIPSGLYLIQLQDQVELKYRKLIRH
ncbi:MAG: S8 family serine peptidase [Algoriphagus sp.]|uniref:S8 family serine peptidase n=1 Tax=Algoriphagus sp. TaxID=1872435 RepID=UPI0017E3216C|nr:S8 family serine peptidase [Algoriphagus sp.]NVJ86061.1 S8 family serine peptidase [Algoriphagus sp.]